MRSLPYATAVAVVGFLLVTLPANAQVDPIEVELDAFWAEVSRTVAESDFEGMQAIYHPDAVFMGFDADAPDTHSVMSITDFLEPFRDGGGEGKESGVEFEFATRVHDQQTAHEVGLFHFWNGAAGQERLDHYGTAEAFLVKKGGRWLVLAEIQRAPSTREAWDALRAREAQGAGIVRPPIDAVANAPATDVEVELDASGWYVATIAS